MRACLLAAGAAVVAIGVGGAASAAEPIVIFGPESTTRVAAQAHQGPHVHGASIGITNGTVDPFYTNVNPTDGGQISSGTNGSNYAVHASAYQPGGAGDLSFSSAASGSSDLRSGKLRGTVDNTYANNFGSPLGFVTDRIMDTIYFNNTTDDVINLAISYSVEGSIDLGPGAASQGGSAQLYLQGCGSCSNAFGQYVTFAANGAGLYHNRMSFNENGVFSYDSSPQWTFTADGVGGTLSTILAIPKGMTTIGVGADLLLDCRAGTDCMFGNTATLGLGPLADGLSYTSASGVFLTARAPSNPGAVPEPAAWALMILGFGGVGAMVRRRRFELA